jgi:hypothetical protein
MVYNGKPTREWLLCKDAARPMAALESIMITGVIEAKEERDVMTYNIPNTFIQALLPKKDLGEYRMVMKITGVLVSMLVDINPELYRPAVVLWCWQELKEGPIRQSIEGHIRNAWGSPIVVQNI